MAKTGYFSGTFTKINNLVLRNEKIRNLKSMYYYIDGIGLKFIKKPKQEQNSKTKVIIVYNLKKSVLPSGRNRLQLSPENHLPVCLFQLTDSYAGVRGHGD